MLNAHTRGGGGGGGEFLRRGWGRFGEVTKRRLVMSSLVEEGFTDQEKSQSSLVKYFSSGEEEGEAVVERGGGAESKGGEGKRN
jgi:hypothetical protein